MSSYTSRLVTACTLAASLPVTAALLGAQASAHPAQVPIDLMVGLLGSGVTVPANRTAYFVDSLPVGWPPMLILPSARLLGGVKTDAMLVAVYSDTSKKALAEYQKVLENNGFAQLRVAEQRGFTNNDAPKLEVYCRGAARVRPVISTYSGHRMLSVTFENGDGEQCSDIGFKNALVLPSLSPPPTTTAIEVGNSVAVNEVRSQTRLASMLPPSVIISSYASQLSAAGWTVGTPAFSNTIASLALETRDRTGRYWYGSLVITSGGDIRDVQLAMRNDRF